MWGSIVKLSQYLCGVELCLSFLSVLVWGSIGKLSQYLCGVVLLSWVRNMCGVALCIDWFFPQNFSIYRRIDCLRMLWAYLSKFRWLPMWITDSPSQSYEHNLDILYQTIHYQIPIPYWLHWAGCWLWQYVIIVVVRDMCVRSINGGMDYNDYQPLCCSHVFLYGFHG